VTPPRGVPKLPEEEPGGSDNYDLLLDAFQNQGLRLAAVEAGQTKVLTAVLRLTRRVDKLLARLETRAAEDALASELADPEE